MTVDRDRPADELAWMKHGLYSHTSTVILPSYAQSGAVHTALSQVADLLHLKVSMIDWGFPSVMRTIV